MLLHRRLNRTKGRLLRSRHLRWSRRRLQCWRRVLLLLLGRRHLLLRWLLRRHWLLLRLLDRNLHPFKKRRPHNLSTPHMQFRIHRFLPILKQLNQPHSHNKLVFIKSIGLRLIRHPPNSFEEVNGEFGKGEEFYGGGTREVACLSFVCYGEEGIVKCLF